MFLHIKVTDDLQMTNPIRLCFDLELVSRNSFFPHIAQCFFNRHAVRKEAYLLKLVADEVLPTRSQQLAEYRIGVANFKRAPIHNENPILRRLEEAPIATFRPTDQLHFGDVVDRQEKY